MTTFLWQTAALCCEELKATMSPQLGYTQEAVQPRCEFRFLCPLQGGGGGAPSFLAAQTLRPLARHSDETSEEEG